MEKTTSGFEFVSDVDLGGLHIEGDRVVLRSICEQYAHEIFSEFTEEITRYMSPSPARNIEETIAFISRIGEGMKKGRDLVCVILKKESGEFLGCCGFHGYALPATPELGIWIKKSAHGHRYGREAIKVLVDWALRTVQFESLVYPVDRANIASRKIPESLGGTIVRERMAKRMNGGSLDEVLYRIPREVLLGPGPGLADRSSRAARETA